MDAYIDEQWEDALDDSDIYELWIDTHLDASIDGQWEDAPLDADTDEVVEGVTSGC